MPNPPKSMKGSIPINLTKAFRVNKEHIWLSVALEIMKKVFL